MRARGVYYGVCGKDKQLTPYTEVGSESSVSPGLVLPPCDSSHCPFFPAFCPDFMNFPRRHIFGRSLFSDSAKRLGIFRSGSVLTSQVVTEPLRFCAIPWGCRALCLLLFLKTRFTIATCLSMLSDRYYRRGAAVSTPPPLLLSFHIFAGRQRGCSSPPPLLLSFHAQPGSLSNSCLRSMAWCMGNLFGHFNLFLSSLLKASAALRSSDVL